MSSNKYTYILLHSCTLLLFFGCLFCDILLISYAYCNMQDKNKTKKEKKKHNTTTEVKGGVEARRSRWGRYKESEDNEEGGGDGMKQDISMYTVLI